MHSSPRVVARTLCTFVIALLLFVGLLSMAGGGYRGFEWYGVGCILTVGLQILLNFDRG